MKIFLLIFLALLMSCTVQEAQAQNKKKPTAKVKNKTPRCEESVENKLKYYFYGREIEPSVIVNNTQRTQTKIKLENNQIEWIRGEKEIKIKINDDLFSLEDKKTLNEVINERKEDVDFADNWEQIKLYKFGDREVIGISMGNEPCTGIGCSVAFQLIYDLKTKSKIFFGTYRIDREVRLFDFKNDGTLDYLTQVASY